MLREGEKTGKGEGHTVNTAKSNYSWVWGWSSSIPKDGEAKAPVQLCRTPARGLPLTLAAQHQLGGRRWAGRWAERGRGKVLAFWKLLERAGQLQKLPLPVIPQVNPAWRTDSPIIQWATGLQSYDGQSPLEEGGCLTRKKFLCVLIEYPPHTWLYSSVSSLPTYPAHLLAGPSAPSSLSFLSNSSLFTTEGYLL